MGILYCRAGQGSEEEMYNNQEAGAAFMQFLTLLGDVVRLKGFESYRAQLDTKSERPPPPRDWRCRAELYQCSLVCGGWG